MDRLEGTSNTDESVRVLQDCSYRNSSDRMVILRCCGSQQFFLERVVFPFEILAFSCPPMSEIKIWSHGLYGPELLETYLSDNLLVEPFPDMASLEPSGMFPTPSTTLRTTPWLQAG